MKTLLIAIIALWPATITLSQVDHEPILTSPPRYTFKFSAVDIDLGSMNRTLVENGFASIESILSREINIITKRPKPRIGATIGVLQMLASNNDYRTLTPGANVYQSRTLKGYGVKFGSEYYIVNKERFKLYTPYCFQFTKFKFTTFENIPLIFHFSNTHDIIEKKYTVWKESLEFGINAEYGIPTGFVMWLIGVNFGYRIDIGDNPWKYSDEISIGFPKVKNQGFVFGISFGISRRPRLYNAPRDM